MISATGNRLTAEIRRQSALANAIAREQVAVSTGKKIQRGSDDPLAASRIAKINRGQSDAASWAVNLQTATARNADADRIMSGVVAQATRAREVLIAGANGTASSADRAVIASELSAIADEIDSLSATRSISGDPVFAATATVMRVGADLSLAPVPSRAEAFAPDGISTSATIRDAANAIASGNRAAIDASLAATDRTISAVGQVAADIGIRGAKIERLLDQTRAFALNAAEDRSTLEDTDLSTAISRLNGLSVTLEAAQAAFARINRRTLFDILG